MKHSIPSQSVLQQLLHYDPETGVLTWRSCGRLAGTKIWQKDGEPAGKTISIGRVRYKVNRVIWQLVHGSIPEGCEIDHRNHNPWDDRLDNLRTCTHAQNNINRRLRPPKGSGFRGVQRNKNGRYVARIGGDSPHRHIGVYDTAEEASAAYQAAVQRLYGDFLCFKQLPEPNQKAKVAAAPDVHPPRT